MQLMPQQQQALTVNCNHPDAMNRFSYMFLVFAFVGCGHLNKPEKTVDVNASGTNSDSVKVSPAIVTANKPEVYKIFPTDESVSDRSLMDFIDKLRLTVTYKDTAELLNTLDNGIVVSHGGGIYGAREFSDEWKLHKGDKSQIWSTLKTLLSLGGTWEKDAEGNFFCIPYTQSNKAFSKYRYSFDWYFTAVCISPSAEVYEKPTRTSKVVGILEYDIVEIDPAFESSYFSKVSTIDRKIIGYVRSNKLQFSSDRQLTIRKINNQWKVTSFAPFD